VAHVSVASAAVGNFASEALQLRALGGEEEGELLHAGVVPDQHERGDRVVDGADRLEQVVRGSAVELVIQLERRRVAQRGL
jgi:hypothetical protein